MRRFWNMIKKAAGVYRGREKALLAAAAVSAAGMGFDFFMLGVWGNNWPYQIDISFFWNMAGDHSFLIRSMIGKAICWLDIGLLPAVSLMSAALIAGSGRVVPRLWHFAVAGAFSIPLYRLGWKLSFWYSDFIDSETDSYYSLGAYTGWLFPAIKLCCYIALLTSFLWIISEKHGGPVWREESTIGKIAMALAMSGVCCSVMLLLCRLYREGSVREVLSWRHLFSEGICTAWLPAAGYALTVPWLAVFLTEVYWEDRPLSENLYLEYGQKNDLG